MYKQVLCYHLIFADYFIQFEQFLDICIYFFSITKSADISYWYLLVNTDQFTSSDGTPGCKARRTMSPRAECRGAAPGSTCGIRDRNHRRTTTGPVQKI